MTIYVASKIRHAPMWRKYREQGIPIISTWIDRTEEGCDYVQLWRDCIDEARGADFLIVYAEHEPTPEVLKGAFVEVGAALSNWKPVFAVGLRESDGSWIRHPLVTKCGNIEEALILIGVK